MIPPLLALLFACDLDSVFRAAAKSQLPTHTARNVTAKLHYAETMHKIGSLAPTTPQEELKIAHAMAKSDPGVVRAIDTATRCFDEGRELPARLTIHVIDTASFGLVVDGVFLHVNRDSVTAQLAAGTHEISINDGEMSAKTTVTLAEGEPKSIDLRPDTKLDDPRHGYAIDPHVDRLLTDENLGKLCLTVFRGIDGQPVAMKSIDHVTIEKRGTFEADDLFKISDDGDVCATDAAALREITGEGGPIVIHVVGRAASEPHVDAATLLSYGHEVVIRGTVPEAIHLVSRNGQPAVPVKDGKFEIKVPEGRVELFAETDAQHPQFGGYAELHCDAEVRFTRDKLEIVKGGCPDAGGGAWREAAVKDFEELQQLGFNFADGAIKPASRTVLQDRPIESATEEALQSVTGEGGLQIRATSENGTVVFRSTTGLNVRAMGDVPSTQFFTIELPLTARYVDIKGWTPETTGRFDVKDFSAPR